MRSAAVQNLAGMVLTAALLAGVGAGLFRVDAALAGVGARRAEMLAAGVDRMPVGTSRQVDRAKQLRARNR